MPDPVVSSPTQPPPPQPRRRRWLRRIAFALAAIAGLVVIAYFVLTSAAFLKGVVLPKVGESLHARITIADATIHPFSEVAIRGLKVETTGTEPLVTAEEARARYSLWDILHGQIRVDEVLLLKPIVTIVQSSNGASNLDPLTQSGSAGPKKAGQTPPSPRQGGSGPPPQLDLRKVALQDATVRIIQQHSGGSQDRTELSKVNITLDNLKNGQTGKLALAADILRDSQSPVPGANGSLQAKFEGAFDVALGNDLSLSALKGGMRLSVPVATGALAQVNGFSLALETDLSADPGKQTAVLRTFKLTGARSETTLVLASLSNPFTVSLGGGTAAAGDAALTVVLTNLNLADWKGLAQELDPAGNVHGTLTLTSQQSGKQLGLTLAARVENLGLKLGTNALTELDVNLSVAGRAGDFKQIDLTSTRFALARRNNPLLTLDTSGQLNLDKSTAELSAHLEAHLQRLLQLAPQAGTTLDSGLAKLDAKLSRRDGAATVGGTLGLSSFTGRLGEKGFTNLAVSAVYDLSFTEARQLDLRRCQLVLAPTPRAATNAVDLSGTLDLSKANALEGALKLVADTLDVTPYYDLFAGPPPPPASASSTSPAPAAPASRKPAPAKPQEEPPAVHLPVKLLTFDANLRRCYLRELVLSNLTASARITADQLTLRPVQLALNGAPVSADVELNLGAPGYKYAVSFQATGVPLEPLANSFSADYNGQAKGDVLAAIHLKGAGITEPSLQKNLAGDFSLTFTNAEIRLVGRRAKALLAPIALILGFSDLLKSPVNWLGAEAKIGDAKLNLNRFDVVSSAFAAGATGEIPLAPKLADSPIPNWPVNFSLRRSLAQSLSMAPKDAPTNTDYVLLPNFVKVGGTVGEPKTQTDNLALLQAGAQAITRLPGNVGKDAVKLLDKAGGLLGGKASGNTNTNSNSSTNPAPASKLFDLLKPKGK